MRRTLKRLPVLVLLGALAALACASEPRVAPPPKREVLNYQLESGDKLRIRVFNRSELSRDVLIRPDGMISMVPFGEIWAAGLTVEELDAVLSERLSSLFANPEVTVFVSEFANQNVYVGGEVGRPGLVPIHQHTTSLMAIISAGGLTDKSRKTHVVVLRDSGRGQPDATVIDLKEVLAGQSADMVLEPYDVVFVATSNVAKANFFIEQYIRRVIPFRLVASGNFTYVSGKGIQGDTLP